MISLMQDLPENTVGVNVSGQVTGRDYEEVLIPAVEEKLKDRDGVRLLYHLDKDFSSFDAKAMWDDAKVGMQHLMQWERIAVVTDKDWVTNSVKAFGLMVPCPIRTYKIDELNDAKTWIAE